MKQTYTRGASSLLIIFIVVILGVIAYSIFKNINQQNLSSVEQPVIPQENTPAERSYPKQETTIFEINQKTTTELSSQDISAMEQETAKIDTEIQDLMFEDLAVE